MHPGSQTFILPLTLLFSMKRDLLEILACPLCKGDLTLEVFEENEREIVTGRLCCSACRECYPIEEGIPNLLPPQLRER
ncbi:MAG: methytransferase partner Trm112 [Methanothrix sp.]|nr:methytransferase partner Trm112 [Methanothrix sp.]